MDKQAVAADKKKGLRGIHLLNAWSIDNKICLGQLKIDDKSNEIAAMSQLLDLLDSPFQPRSAPGECSIVSLLKTSCGVSNSNTFRGLLLSRNSTFSRSSREISSNLLVLGKY